MLSEVLAVFWEGRQTHSLQTVLAMRCETTHNNSTQHFQGNSGEIVYQSKPDSYLQAYEEYNTAKGGYIDAHKWRFTPSSFYYIITELKNMGIINLSVEKVFNTRKDDIEFFAVLKMD